MSGPSGSQRARRTPRSTGLILALLTLAPGAVPGGAFGALTAQEPSVDRLEALLAAPFPSDMTGAPRGGLVAWVENRGGVRNIRVAGPPDYTGRLVTAYTDDDGQEIGSLAWTPDASAIVYVRGGGPNRQGEHPNPASDPEGADRALWVVPVEDGEPARIDSGASPAVSPTGDGVAYIRGGDVWFAPLDGSGEPAPLIRVRGGPGSLRWSPDGSRLAFVSGRGTHAFIGVYERSERTVAWMAPSVDRDSSPVWSPEGRRLAFLRVPSSTMLTLFRPVREAHPWSIHVADPSTGEAREIWRADEGRGSAYWGITASDQLFWGADDRIVFAWERTGWVLLYSVAAGGGDAIALTPGELEVEDAALGPDGRHVYYTSNQDDIHRRHLWRVAVTGGPPTALTSGDGIEWSATPLDAAGTVAFLRSGARAPAEPAIILEGAVRLIVTDADRRDFPEASLVVPEPVTVVATDGMRVPAQLFLPPDLAPGERRPAVAFFHGGSRRQMLLGFHNRSYYHHAYALNQHLATLGYVVLSVNFRSGIGYGMEFREAPGYGAAGGSEFRDVVGAGRYLAGRADVDPERIGVWGGSYGGYLTAMALSRAPELFAAGVDVHGVHDWNIGIQTFRPDYDPLEDPEGARVAFEASPMSSVDGWRAPVLVIHGDDDRNVRFLETVMLVEALRERGVHVEQLVFPNEVHSFLLHRNWLLAYRATVEFLDRKLGSR